MLSTYSNYDSESFTIGTKNKVGGLNPNQEFRPQPQTIDNGAGLLISIKTDLMGELSIDFTNIIDEPYDFIDKYEITDAEINASDKTETLNGVTFKVIARTYLMQIKAKNFRIRFRNNSSQKQKLLQLFTFILPNIPVFALVDSKGDKIDTIVPSTGTVRAIYTHNIFDYAYSLLTFTYNAYPGNIISSSYQLKKFKNFDIIFQFSANNLIPIRLYVYESIDNSVFAITNHYIDVYYGYTNRTLTNITVNGDYIKLQGVNMSDNVSNKLTISSCYICEKG